MTVWYECGDCIDSKMSHLEHLVTKIRKKIFPIQAAPVTGRQIAIALKNRDPSEISIMCTWFVTSENPGKNIQRVSHCVKKKSAATLLLLIVDSVLIASIVLLDLILALNVYRLKKKVYLKSLPWNISFNINKIAERQKLFWNRVNKRCTTHYV